MNTSRHISTRRFDSTRPLIAVVVSAAIAIAACGNFRLVAGEQPASVEKNLPASRSEAAGRARWLHETIHGALQVMHRDFFGDGDEGDLTLPSQSLEDVFKEMARSWSVEIRWLGVNATRDEDHHAEDEFEKAAVKALLAGKPEYSEVEKGNFRFVGAITLHNQCLKCHVPDRTSMEDRVAGLSMTIPLKEISKGGTEGGGEESGD